jgi:hypothetical protein
MTRLLALSLVALLAACGGGGSGGGDGGTPAPGEGTPPPTDSTPDGGATGGTNSLAVTGTRAFTPAGQVGITSTASPCTIRGTSTSASVVAVVVASEPLTCDTVSASRPSSLLHISVARVRNDQQAASAVTTGTYPIRIGEAPLDEPSAAVTVLKSASGGVDAPDLGGGIGIGGSVTLTSVGDTIVGTVDVSLIGGGTVTGSFSVASCAAPTPATACFAVGGTPPVPIQFPTAAP